MQTVLKTVSVGEVVSKRDISQNSGPWATLLKELEDEPSELGVDQEEG